MSLEKNQVIPLTITGFTNEGVGVGHFEGQAVFVPYSASEDVLQVKIVKAMDKYAYGKIQEIVTPSSTRISSECPAYEKCGGCSYQHVLYENELHAKEQIVIDAMQRIGKISAPVLPIVPSPTKQQYRNKVIYPLCKINGVTHTGFFASRSHRIVPVSNCMLQPSSLNEISNFVCEIIDKHRLSVYEEESHRGLMRYIYLRQADVTGHVMLCFVINGKELPHAGQICRALTTKFPDIQSIMLNINTAKTNVMLGKKYINLVGKDFLIDTLADVSLQISPASFYQVNHAACETLYSIVKDFADLKSTDIVLDLYCGVGSIGLSFANSCEKLVGVEIVDDAIKMANANAKLNNITNASFISEDAGIAADKLAEDGLLPNVVIVDPPRKGCDTLTLNAIVKMNPEKVVMVSCNPATAARDAQTLQNHGFKTVKIQPLDMFPRTKHVECVVLMTKEI